MRVTIRQVLTGHPRQQTTRLEAMLSEAIFGASSSLTGGNRRSSQAASIQHLPVLGIRSDPRPSVLHGASDSILREAAVEVDWLSGRHKLTHGTESASG